MRPFLLAALLITTVAVPPVAAQEEAAAKSTEEQVPLPPRKGTKTVAGWAEYVTIPMMDDKRFRAKLDSGAETTSINAEVIAVHLGEAPPDDAEAVEAASELSRNTVIFSIPGNKGKRKTFERRMVRWARIKRKEGGFIERPVVRFSICLAGEKVTADVNLAERSHFQYPVLIGRNMLRKRGIVVDSGSTFLTTVAGCVDEPEQKVDTVANGSTHLSAPEAATQAGQ